MCPGWREGSWGEPVVLRHPPPDIFGRHHNTPTRENKKAPVSVIQNNHYRVPPLHIPLSLHDQTILLFCTSLNNPTITTNIFLHFRYHYFSESKTGLLKVFSLYQSPTLIPWTIQYLEVIARCSRPHKHRIRKVVLQLWCGLACSRVVAHLTGNLTQLLFVVHPVRGQETLFQAFGQAEGTTAFSSCTHLRFLKEEVTVKLYND